MVEVWRKVAEAFAGIAAIEHVALYVTALICWLRRRSVERTLAAFFAIAFATSALALLSTPGAFAAGSFAALLAALWAREAARAEGLAVFATTPRPRLIAMGALALFGLAYPGYSGDLPALLFAPFGVLLQPTLLVALALANSMERTPRALHWALGGSGLLWGAVGAFTEGPIHAPLIVASLWAIPLALGRGRKRVPEERGPGSVREIQDRMYNRWTLLPGPRDPRSRSRPTRGRRW